MSIDFVAIDFETANHSRASACSVGMVKVLNGEIVDSIYTLINPETHFDDYNIYIHGITPETVSKAPVYSDIALDILSFSNGLPLVAHYAPFDMGVIKDSNDRYGIADFKIEYFDSYYLSMQFINAISYKLSHLAKHIGVDFAHHNALEDAKLCAKLVLYLCQEHSFCSIKELMSSVRYNKFGLVDGFSGSGFRRTKNRTGNRNYSSIDINAVLSKIDRSSLDQSHPFFDKYACFTGKLERFTRKEAMVYFAELGGFPEKGVTKKTNFLVMGEQDIRVVGEDMKSSKMIKAEKMLADGFNIQLLGENDFLRMV